MWILPPRQWADLLGPSHHPELCGFRREWHSRWWELPLPAGPTQNEDHEFGPFSSFSRCWKIINVCALFKAIPLCIGKGSNMLPWSQGTLLQSKIQLHIKCRGSMNFSSSRGPTVCILGSKLSFFPGQYEVVWKSKQRTESGFLILSHHYHLCVGCSLEDPYLSLFYFIYKSASGVTCRNHPA